eukprot:8394313-Lingulodinium_polyedra.AAC.1
MASSLVEFSPPMSAATPAARSAGASGSPETARAAGALSFACLEPAGTNASRPAWYPDRKWLGVA